MVDLATWRTLFYPLEWMFRFLSVRGDLAGYLNISPPARRIRLLRETVGVFVVAVLQVWVLLRFAWEQQDIPVVSQG